MPATNWSTSAPRSHRVRSSPPSGTEARSTHEFAGKVAVVTGAASGIGLGLATRLAEEGMHVVLADVEAPALVQAIDSLRERGHSVLGVHTHVAQAESVAALARQTLEAFGKVHVCATTPAPAAVSVVSGMRR